MKTVSAGLFVRASKILIARRAKGQNLEGFWEFPGGKQEEGETIFECLQREIKEEFGLHCSSGKILCESEYHYTGGAIKLVGIIADLSAGDPVLTVHDEIKWVEITALKTYQLAPADIAIADAVQNQYQQMYENLE